MAKRVESDIVIKIQSLGGFDMIDWNSIFQDGSLPSGGIIISGVNNSSGG